MAVSVTTVTPSFAQAADRIAVSNQDTFRTVTGQTDVAANADCTVNLTAAQQIKDPQGRAVAPSFAMAQSTAATPVIFSVRSMTASAIVLSSSGASGAASAFRLTYG
jgi:hypothetical protein